MPTYKQFKKFLRDKCWNERDYGEGIYDKLIYDFLVEEVKENKEPGTSILEKLREELERRINSEEWSTPYMEVKWELEEVLDFVNSLETKENKEPTWVDDLQGISKLIEEDVKKEQFTPGQTNYCDSRTDDERARDEELYRTATVTSTSNVWTPTPGLATYIKENRNTVTLVQIEDLNPVIQYIVERIKALNSPEYEMENPDPIYELQAVLNKIKETNK